MMKILFARLTIACIIMGLLTSGAIHKDKAGVRYRNFLSVITNDTTGLTGFIETDTFNLAILKPSSGVQFYRDGIVFLSLAKNEESISPNHISFGTIEAYYAKTQDSVLGKHIVFSSLSSFSFPCEGISFSPDFNTMYFTKIPKKERKEKIFRAKFTAEGRGQTGWVSELVPLDFCKGDYTYSHPTITADENVMIFASDMEGSLGGMDLFITRKVGNSWSVPQNLGKSINSSGNEFFPFLDSDNNLYFSSDGLGGYGGYDIFTCKFNGKVWDKPINLSDRINSENDDIAFTISKMDGRTAFYTKRPISGNGEMQLFRVTLNKEFAGSDQLTISYIFHGKPQLINSLSAFNTFAQVKPDKEESVKEEPVKTGQKNVVLQKETITKPPKKKRVPKDKRKEIVIVSPVSIPPIPVLINWEYPKLVLKTIPPIIINKSNDGVVYRVQILSSKTSKGNFQVIVNNKTYDTYEYLYLGEYRYTIGEFRTLASAVEVQNACKKDGRLQVFVVVFKNNVRSLDPQLFK
jgi:hypothetical protein